MHLIPRDALILLDKAVRESPVLLYGVSDILLLASKEMGTLYIAEEESEIKGVIFVDVCRAEYGTTLNIVEAAGELKKYRNEFMDFIRRLMQDNKCQNMVCTTHTGMHKILPDFKPVGTFYEYKITH